MRIFSQFRRLNMFPAAASNPIRPRRATRSAPLDLTPRIIDVRIDQVYLVNIPKDWINVSVLFPVIRLIAAASQ